MILFAYIDKDLSKKIAWILNDLTDKTFCFANLISGKKVFL